MFLWLHFSELSNWDKPQWYYKVIKWGKFNLRLKCTQIMLSIFILFIQNSSFLILFIQNFFTFTVFTLDQTSKWNIFLPGPPSLLFSIHFLMSIQRFMNFHKKWIVRGISISISFSFLSAYSFSISRLTATSFPQIKLILSLGIFTCWLFWESFFFQFLILLPSPHSTSSWMSFYHNIFPCYPSSEWTLGKPPNCFF